MGEGIELPPSRITDSVFKQRDYFIYPPLEGDRCVIDETGILIPDFDRWNRGDEVSARCFVAPPVFKG